MCPFIISEFYFSILRVESHYSEKMTFYFCIVIDIILFMSSEKISREKLALSLFSEKVYKLWPWLKEVQPQISAQDLNNYYEMTYAFGEETWKDRLADGTDEDESQRAIFTILLCLEFEFDGSKPSKPSLWEFWRQLHKQVICPCFKAGNGEDVILKYISWPAKTFGLDEGLLRVIWHKVYDTTESTIEEDWISEYFHAWMMADRKEFISRTHTQYISETRDKSRKKEEPKDEEKEEVKKPKRKAKPPAPKKRSVPKPGKRKPSAEMTE